MTRQEIKNIAIQKMGNHCHESIYSAFISGYAQRDTDQVLANLPSLQDIQICSPDWITPPLKEQIKKLWGSPNFNGSNPRVQAIKLLRQEAKRVGYSIDIKKSNELISNWCL